ncbi:YonK family protein [Mammaliicoccus sciuri]|uniref:YonK family protein n=1 Tax=Mammaliicoccus sciuri TaxID=1296 RepID=UPI001C6277A4|nr:YonK family protein [Mammaliicoccus sciuri]QYG30002.1 YonK family protein [Mammaliicoccus sciuri]
MAKITNSVAFKNATVSLADNEIIEITKDAEHKYSLSEVLDRFEGKFVSITIKEDSELGAE